MARGVVQISRKNNIPVTYTGAEHTHELQAAQMAGLWKEVNEDCFGTSFCTCRWKVTCIGLWKEVKKAAVVGLSPYMPLQSGT